MSNTANASNNLGSNLYPLGRAVLSCTVRVKKPLRLLFTNTTPSIPRRMTSPLYSSYDLFVSSGTTVDADGAASDGGYSSDGDISSMYGAYSQHKRRKHERWTEFSLPSAQQE